MLLDLVSAKFKLWSAVILLAALAAAVLWYGEWRADSREEVVNTRWEAATLKLKVDAARRLADEVSLTLRLESSLETLQAKNREVEHARNVDRADAERRLAAAVAAGRGRLRDPHSAGCGGGGGGAPAAIAAGASVGAGDSAEAGGVLSAQLTGLLQRLTREADEVNDAYAACRSDTLGLRQTLQLSPP